MSDIEFYEKWCEYNKNNLPISFAEFCYEQGRADEQLESIEDAKMRTKETIMAIEEARKRREQRCLKKLWQLLKPR